MRQRVQYLYIELKKTICMFPRMFLQAILLMVLIGAIAFCGVKSMGREPLAVNVNIGIVVREDNRMTRLALNYVENMESVSQLCRFVQVSEKEGLQMLEQGELAALVVLPEQLVEGIMNGENPSVDVVFPENARLEAMLFRELTESGAGLLRVAQAQIYGAVDTAREYGLTEQLSVIERDIDSYNLAFALDRLAIFDDEEVSATGQMSVLQYYVASGVILFLLLSGMAAYPIMQREPAAFRCQLIRHGVGEIWQFSCRWLCGFVCISLPVFVIWVILQAVGFLAPELTVQLTSALISDRNHAAMGICIGVMLLIILTVTTLIYLIYSLAGSRTAGILLIFLVSVLMVYLSGGFVPSVLMPEAMQTVGEVLPASYLIHAFGSLMTGYRSGTLAQYVAGMCAYTVIFGAAGYLLECRK